VRAAEKRPLQARVKDVRWNAVIIPAVEQAEFQFAARLAKMGRKVFARALHGGWWHNVVY